MNCWGCELQWVPGLSGG